MTGNPSPDTPPAPQIGGWFERYKRWYNAHVLHRLPGSKRQRIVRYAKASLAYHGRMVYTEGPQRSELFHRKPGKFLGAGADCSQYSASLCHWVGVKSVNDKDYTGTLAEKGKRIASPKRGAFVFFGSPPYVHMGVLVKPLLSRTWHVIEFGEQAAPDETPLPVLLAYFEREGHPGHEFRDLT